MSSTSRSSVHFSRRSLLRAGTIALAAGAVGTAAPQAFALGPVLGTVVDFSAGVPSSAALKAAGQMGAVRYVSKPRAGWMAGKPVTRAQAAADAAAGLAVASVYQYNGSDNPDWAGGAASAAQHAPQAIAIHKAAGGPTGRPIYIAIDNNPSRAQYDGQIKPYLVAFSTALKAAGYQVGVYGNYNIIDWCVRDGIGSYFWMHDWGSGGRIHPRTTIHQLPQNRQRTIGGVVCDINDVYAKDWGQWTPGRAAAPAPAAPAAPANTSNPLNAVGQMSSQVQNAVPGLNLPQVSPQGVSFNGSSVDSTQIQAGVDLVQTVLGAMR
ncbi:DUF1906 domain-containing protein [Corynebacterium phoceense]|uniref:DUF1906 domain-containing protein n=1 Tax=Corynebacterium phoceense TaxID=1686286 RepID=UPI001DF68201|nr:DUF1906 domain-containing protein [Corynebacterium phoceense]HJG42926.1 DUF1906 domain-containing protein [Corynebacterium phoceense]